MPQPESAPRSSIYRQALRAAAAAVAALALAGIASADGAAVSPADPLAGKWLGTCGTERERVAVGVEIRAAADGTTQLLLTQPVMNYFAVEAPGPVVREENRVKVDALHLDLELRDGRLEGFFPGPKSPARLQRVDALPVDPGPPAVPAGPGPRWQTRLSGQIYASPVVEGGVAYVGTTGGAMNAVDTRDGKILWAVAADGPIFGSVAVAGDALYFAADDGWLRKLARADGREIWRYDLGDARAARVLPHPQVFAWDWQGAAPVVADGVVFVGAGDGGFHAVDAATGERRWRFATGGRIRNGAAIDGARVLVGSADRFLYALDLDSGRELWRFDTGAEVDATPVVHDGRVLIGNRGYGLHAVDAATGSLIWKTFFWGSWVESTPVVVGGTIYLGASDLRRVSAIDPADGRVLWRSDVFGWSWGTPLVAGERIYAGAAGGTPYFLRHVAGFAVLDRASGRMLERWPIPDSPDAHQWGIAGSPALAGDTVVVATIGGSLYGFPAR